MTPWTIAGVATWALALGGESIADAQLARFRHDPANKGCVCDVGLWRYSRHPNYFFEWLVWCGFALLALPACTRVPGEPGPLSGYGAVEGYLLECGQPVAAKLDFRTRGSAGIVSRVVVTPDSTGW